MTIIFKLVSANINNGFSGNPNSMEIRDTHDFKDISISYQLFYATFIELKLNEEELSIMHALLKILMNQLLLVHMKIS